MENRKGSRNLAVKRKVYMRYTAIIQNSNGESEWKYCGKPTWHLLHSYDLWWKSRDTSNSLFL